MVLQNHCGTKIFTAIFISIGPANFFYTDGIQYKHISDQTHVVDSCRLCHCDASTASHWPNASFVPDPQIEPNRTYFNFIIKQAENVGAYSYEHGCTAVFIMIGPDLPCLFRPCLVLSEDLTQKKHKPMVCRNQTSSSFSEPVV